MKVLPLQNTDEIQYMKIRGNFAAYALNCQLHVVQLSEVASQTLTAFVDLSTCKRELCCTPVLHIGCHNGYESREMGFSADMNTFYVVFQTSYRATVVAYSGLHQRPIVMTQLLEFSRRKTQWWHFLLGGNTLLRVEPQKIQVYCLSENNAKKIRGCVRGGGSGRVKRGGSLVVPEISEDGELFCMLLDNTVCVFQSKNCGEVFRVNGSSRLALYSIAFSRRALWIKEDDVCFDDENGKYLPVETHWFYNQKELFTLTAAFFLLLPPYLILQLCDTFVFNPEFCHAQKIRFILEVRERLLALQKRRETADED